MTSRLATIALSLPLCAAAAFGCSGDDTSGETRTTTTSPSGNESGSETSAAHGSASVTGATSDSTGATTSGESGESGDITTSATTGLPGNPLYECDQWAQDCPEGQKCSAYGNMISSSWDATKCVDVTGTDKPGEPCIVEGATSGVDSCIAGAMCWGANEQGIGTCVPLCTGSTEARVCPAHRVCTVSGVLNLCLPSCNPVLQDCLDPALSCYLEGGVSFGCYPDVSGEKGQVNDPCEAFAECDEGLTCAGAAFVGVGCAEGSFACCTPWCEFPDGACPNPDQQCLEVFDSHPAPTPEYAKIGFCGVPS